MFPDEFIEELEHPSATKSWVINVPALCERRSYVGHVDIADANRKWSFWRTKDSEASLQQPSNAMDMPSLYVVRISERKVLLEFDGFSREAYDILVKRLTHNLDIKPSANTMHKISDVLRKQLETLQGLFYQQLRAPPSAYIQGRILFDSDITVSEMTNLANAPDPCIPYSMADPFSQEYTSTVYVQEKTGTMERDFGREISRQDGHQSLYTDRLDVPAVMVVHLNLPIGTDSLDDCVPYTLFEVCNEASCLTGVVRNPIIWSSDASRHQCRAQSLQGLCLELRLEEAVEEVIGLDLFIKLARLEACSRQLTWNHSKNAAGSESHVARTLTKQPLTGLDQEEIDSSHTVDIPLHEKDDDIALDEDDDDADFVSPPYAEIGEDPFYGHFGLSTPLTDAREIYPSSSLCEQEVAQSCLNPELSASLDRQNNDLDQLALTAWAITGPASSSLLLKRVHLGNGVQVRLIHAEETMQREMGLPLADT
jgi:hypothetical protein